MAEESNIRSSKRLGSFLTKNSALGFIICLFVFAVPMLLGGIILLIVAAGAFDSVTRTREFSFSWSNRERSTTAAWLQHNEEDCEQWQDWQYYKTFMGYVGIAVIVIAILCIVGAVALIVLLNRGYFNRPGSVHQPLAPLLQTSYGQYSQVTYGNQQPVQMQMYPVQQQKPYPVQGYPGHQTHAI